MSVLFVMKIESGSDAFSEYPREEVIRILQDVIDTMRYGEDDFISKTLRDVNGNSVGTLYFEIEEEESHEN